MTPREKALQDAVGMFIEALTVVDCDCVSWDCIHMDAVKAGRAALALPPSLSPEEVREAAANLVRQFRERGNSWRKGRQLVNGGHADRDEAIADAILALDLTPAKEG